jgi:hypothetical protein
MLYREFSAAPRQSRSTADFFGTAQRLCEHQGLISRARQRETPHLVDVVGLTRTHLTGPGEFERELSLRVEWCRTYAPDYANEIIGPNSDQVSGRRFRFRDISIAALFRGTFPTNLMSNASKVG